jgi:hypothetical protein
MKKQAGKRQPRQKRPDVVVPPSPYDFKETVQRMLKAQPMPRVTRNKAKITTKRHSES